MKLEVHIGNFIRFVVVHLRFVAHASAVTAVALYVWNYWKGNEAFYRMDGDHGRSVTNLPAFTVCPVPAFSFGYSGRRWTEEEVSFLGGVLTGRRRYCSGCHGPISEAARNVDLMELSEDLMKPCEDVLVRCSWSGVLFQCCRHFQRIRTRKGPCFSLNSRQTNDSVSPPLDMTMSFHKPNPHLELVATADVTVHVHDGKDVDFFVKVPKIRVGQKAEIIYKFTEWGEDENAWLLPREDRNCSLEGEDHVDGANAYSYSACRLRCLAVEQQRKCGCQHHLLPLSGAGRVCNLTGLTCLDRGFGNINAHYESAKCRCLQECARLEVTYVQYLTEASTGHVSQVSATLSSPPTHRIVLTSKLTTVDLIVNLSCLSRLVTNKNFPRLIGDSLALARGLYFFLFRGWEPTNSIGRHL